MYYFFYLNQIDNLFNFNVEFLPSAECFFAKIISLVKKCYLIMYYIYLFTET